MNLSLVITPEQLGQQPLDGLKIVDLRPFDAYSEAHLPGAIHLDAALLNRSEAPVGGLLPQVEQVQEIAARLDLRNTDHIVAYDQGAGTPAARLIWVLHAYGFSATSWLDGGFKAWTAASLPTNTDAVAKSGSVSNPSEQHARLQLAGGNVLGVDELMAQLNNDTLRVLDVRSTAEFNGSDIRSARGGHVPNAMHAEWTTVFDENGRLKSDDELRQLFSALESNTDDPVIVYCQTHQRSALTYVVLKHLQYKNVRALDGAWSAWASRDDTPIDSESRPSN